MEQLGLLLIPLDLNASKSQENASNLLGSPVATILEISIKIGRYVAQKTVNKVYI